MVDLVARRVGAHPPTPDGVPGGLPRGVPATLAQLRTGSPAAVLMVELASRTVVHADPVAEQMAPGLALPVSVEDWSDAAELRDSRGAALSDTDHPLTRVARSEPVDGQAVSAARASELGRRREPLWVVALPMADAPHLEGHALVVFLPLAERAAAERAATDAVEQAELRDAALLATGVSFTVADARAEDLPLLWVNPAFTATTGYSADEVVGRNCRFLQGPATDPEGPRLVREAVRRGEPATVVLLNYRKDGTAFWNQLALSPVRGAAGELTHFVGIQTDVTGRVDADRERDRALAAEQAARREAQAAHDRLALLARASSELSATLDGEEALARLTRLLVPALGDWCVATLVDDTARAAAPGTAGVGAGGRGLRDVASWHVDPARRPLVEEYARARIPALTQRSPLAGALRSAAPVVVAEDAAAVVGATLAPGRARDLLGTLAPGACAVFPLRGRGRTVGVLTLFSDPDRGPLTGDQVELMTELAARAGLALDSSRLYRQQRDLASGLQRALLTDTSPARDLVTAVRYVPAAEAAQVGGDWYDAFPTPDGATALVIGDVVGHDTQAAAAMGQVRTVVRTTAVVTGAGPAEVLRRADEALATLGVSTTASAVLVRVEQTAAERAAGTGRLRWSNAGHPPPLLVRGGQVLELSGPSADLLLGVHPQTPRHEHELPLERGTTLLVHTDGLVERRGQPLQEGLAQLRAVVQELVDAGTGDGAQDGDALDRLVDGVLARMLPERPEDDVAVLAVRLRAG